jgi:hypothetical protein
MVRTQIQLPKEVHRRLKCFSEKREWSLAQTIRRAAEEFLDRHPSPEAVLSEWSLPQPKDLGTRQMTARQMKFLAQMHESEEKALRDRGVWPFDRL